MADREAVNGFRELSIKLERVRQVRFQGVEMPKEDLLEALDAFCKPTTAAPAGGSCSMHGPAATEWHSIGLFLGAYSVHDASNSKVGAPISLASGT